MVAGTAAGIVGLILMIYLCCQGRFWRRKRVKGAQGLTDKLEEAKNATGASQEVRHSTVNITEKAGGRCGGYCGERSKTLGTEGKILISLVQVIGSLKVVFSIPYPPLYVQVTRWLSLLEFNLFDMMPLGCAFPGAGFHFFLVLRTIGPLVFFAIALTVRWAMEKKQKNKASGNPKGAKDAGATDSEGKVATDCSPRASSFSSSSTRPTR